MLIALAPIGARSAEGGVTLVQYRAKTASSAEMYAEALQLKALCDSFNVPLIINDRLDIAMAVGAAGVHLGQDDLPCAAARKLLGEDYIIWDKAASIRYRKPGYTTLYADFRVTPEEMAGIRGALAKQHEVDWTFQIDIKDAEDVVHTVVERTVYIAEKNYYRQKSGGGDN